MGFLDSLVTNLAGLSIKESPARQQLPDEYELLELISDEGSGGIVYRCRDKNTNEIVVVKKLFRRVEFDILKTLPPHPCIVELKKVPVDADNGKFVTMESMEDDLDGYLDLTEEPLTPLEAKEIMSRILEGVRFLHENQVMHRDLKPGNILVNHKNKLEVKICDFGSSARFGQDDKPGFRVFGTRGYNAPEVLVEESWPYTCAVDMWSVGCIMAELVWKKQAFPGEEWKSDESEAADESEADSEADIAEQIERIYAKRPLIREKMEAVKDCPTGLDLLEKLLEMDPNMRITAAEALDHPWFKQVD